MFFTRLLSTSVYQNQYFSDYSSVLWKINVIFLKGFETI